MKLFILLLTLLLSTLTLNAHDIKIQEAELKKMIGRMLLVGFANEKIDEKSEIVKLIQKYELGGVILFDRFYDDRTKVKNISSPSQVQELTAKLKSYSTKPMLISVDQEGGKVARLKPKYGFKKIPSAKEVSKMPLKEAMKIYNSQALMLYNNGFNCDFAPVVDLALEPKNKVIYGLERSYGADAKEVSKYAKVFMNSLKNANIVSVLKHFPGHGSSLSDSHKGFVDITNTWDKKELEPYQILIDSKSVNMIMTAHVFNSKLDKKYPATLSYNVNTKLLREKMHYEGVVISDDLQMKAISKHFTLKQIVSLAINSGVDMLLFGNQLATQDIDELVELIYEQLKSGKVSYERIVESNNRLDNLYKKRNIL